MKAKIMGRTIEIPDSRIKEYAEISALETDNAVTSVNRNRPVISRGCLESNERPKARATLHGAPGWPKEDDKWNYAYAKLLEIRRQAGEIIHWWYEPFSIWLPGGVRFKPDYMVWEANNTITIVEVKGWSKNLRDGKARYKIAASLFPCWTWKMVTKKSNQWEEMT